MPNITEYNEFLLSIQYKDSNATLATTIMPKDLFIEAKSGYDSTAVISGNLTNQTLVWCAIQYIDDTSFNIQQITSNISFSLYGR